MNHGGVNLYDKDIRELQNVLGGMKPGRLMVKEPWRCTEKETLVLRSDMAYELGGGSLAAVSGLGFTTDSTLVPENGVYLIGKDLGELKEDTAYARLTLLCLEEAPDWSTGEWYSLFRRLDYTRYHVFPEGYMMRISSVREREPVRIAAKSLEKGMDFAGVGGAFLEAYGKHPRVKAVQTYFVTDLGADFAKLQWFAHRFEEITESMNQVFQGLNMDCSTCGQRELCEEIDGLRELHERVK